jgi:hypothetical protein
MGVPKRGDSKGICLLDVKLVIDAGAVIADLLIARMCPRVTSMIAMLQNVRLLIYEREL